ncbi:MAG: DMT family transporter [Candidatus Cloacimonetes bacterium]|nr:DMT family transporter [Candidatus Cloacimonadota bacterium]
MASAIWGFAFVAQRKGNESMHPLLFNSLRFAIGALALLPFAIRKSKPSRPAKASWDMELILLGFILFIAASLQQIGMLWTGAGNAGFITGLYVVFVPLIGLFRGQKPAKFILLAILFAVTGLWLINQNSSLDASFGNLLVLISAIFWASHVQMIDRLTTRYPSLRLAIWQYGICATLSLLLWIITHILNILPHHTAHPNFSAALHAGMIPVLYGGLGSVAIAYTLQLHAQKKVAPAPASIILCLEAVFALFGGWLLLNEKLSLQSLGGAAALFAAMLISVYSTQKKLSSQPVSNHS